MRLGAAIWGAALVLASSGGVAHGAPLETPARVIVSIYGTEAQAREGLQVLKMAQDRGEVDLEAHAIFAKDAGGKVKVHERRAKGTRAGQAVVAIGAVMGARAGIGVGANLSSGTSYLISNVIGMKSDLIETLMAALPPGQAAVVTAVAERTADAAEELQQAGAERMMSYALPTAVTQPPGVGQPSAPMPRPRTPPGAP